MIAVAIAIAMLLVAEVAFRIGRAIRKSERVMGPTTATIEAGLLGMLGLLLGFTFAMAVSRYDARIRLVVQESNAIGTTFLRATFLDAPHRTDVREMLRDYVDARLAFYRAGANVASLRAVQERTTDLQSRMWNRGAALMRRDPEAVSTALFLTSLNQMIDLEAARTTAIEDHIPEIVLILLWTVAVAAISVTGFDSGLRGGRNPFSMFVTPLLIAAVIVVIMDLDRPTRGLVIGGYQSLVRLRASMEAAGDSIPTIEPVPGFGPGGASPISTMSGAVEPPATR